jgi:putative PEP-CTERM system TPR-repeat lipoprotein
LGVALLGACAFETPETLVRSAKQFLAKKDYPAAWIQLQNALQKRPEYGEAHYLVATALIEFGDFAAAEKSLRRALEFGQSPDLIHPALAKTVLRQGDFKRVVTEFARPALKDPAAQAAVRATAGEAFLALGQRKEAGEAFAFALASVPGDPWAKVGQARLRAMEADLPGAMNLLDGVLAGAPDHTEALALKADLLLSQGKRDEAAAVLSALIRASPHDGRARFALVSVLIDGNTLTPAEEEVRAWKQALPRDVRWNYFEALLAYRKDEPRKARDAVQQVLKTAPEHAPSLLLAGAIEFRLGAFSMAEDYLRKVIARFPDNLHARNLLATTYLRKGRPARAEETLAPALKLAPNDLAVLRTAGEVAFANNRLAEAARFFDQALAAEKDSAVLQTRRAQLRLVMGETERALEDLGAASALDKSEIQADISLVFAHLQRREYDKALAAAATLERKQPSNPFAHDVRGAIQIAMNDTRNARASFEKALALQFNYLPAARNLARLDLAENNSAAARKRFESMLVREPGNEGALLSLAQTLVLTGALANEIKEILDRAIRADPTSVQARAALIGFLAQDPDPKATLSAAQAANAAIPNEATILDALGVAQLAAGEHNQAITTFTNLVAVLPDSPAPLVRLASANFAAKRLDAALQALRKALAIKADNPDALSKVVAVHLAAGHPEEALKEAAAAQKSWPKEAIGFVLQGEALAAQNRPADAARAYAEALRRQPVAGLLVRQHQLLLAAKETVAANALALAWLKENPKDLVVRFYVGNLAQQGKDYKAAAVRYREILAQQPDQVAALNNLAWVLGELNDPAASGYAERAYAKAPANPDVLDTYGWLLFNGGDPKRGIALLNQAASATPKSAEVRMHLAKALLKTGDMASAKKELEAVMQLSGKSPLGVEAEQLLLSR